MSFNYMFKTIVIGDSGVGKSCLLMQFIEHKFNDKYTVTIGVEFGGKNLIFDDKIIKLQIWDTAGQQTFKSITKGYYRSSIGAILVYDITNRDSFTSVARWLEEAKQQGHANSVYVLAGNKCDMESERQVPVQEAMKFAEVNGMEFFEVSAKTGYQVQECFKAGAFQVYKKIKDGTINLDSGNHPGIKVGLAKKGDFLSLAPDRPESSNKCCGRS